MSQEPDIVTEREKFDLEKIKIGLEREKLRLERLDSVSARLQVTWERYIDAVHRFIALNISVIVGVGAAVSFLPRLHGAGDVAAVLASKGFLFIGVVLLMVSLLFEVMVRIWVQQFMEYEVLQPRDAVQKYFDGRVHFTRSYRLKALDSGPTCRWNPSADSLFLKVDCLIREWV